MRSVKNEYVGSLPSVAPVRLVNSRICRTVEIFKTGRRDHLVVLTGLSLTIGCIYYSRRQNKIEKQIC